MVAFLPPSSEELGELKISLEEKLRSYMGRQMTPQARREIEAFLRSEFQKAIPDLPMPQVLFLRRLGMVFIGDLDEEAFRALTGSLPQVDDLERANCTKAGEQFHSVCGICEEHEVPRTYCGCTAVSTHARNLNDELR